MKKQIKKLTLLKEKVSILNAAQVVGGIAPDDGGDVPAGPPQGPATFLREGCGLSVHAPMCAGS
jgi:hypothetical protein